jgi:hypothetical protein
MSVACVAITGGCDQTVRIWELAPATRRTPSANMFVAFGLGSHWSIGSRPARPLVKDRLTCEDAVTHRFMVNQLPVGRIFAYEVRPNFVDTSGSTE